MFKIRNTILSDEIAKAKFACDLGKCKGACCVVGDAGAPVEVHEIPYLRKAYQKIKHDLHPVACKTVEQEGLVKESERGCKINCVDGNECVFVTYNEDGVARCAIQTAYIEGRLQWEKPISCHLFPVRLKRKGEFDYASFDYLPSICAAGCERGEEEVVYLSDFLKEPLSRRYGEAWYEEFLDACEKVRERDVKEQEVAL